jgi:CRP/FNR family transcriptional regulator
MHTPLTALWAASSQFRKSERHDRKVMLFAPDDPATTLYRVEAGCVKLLKSLPDGRCQILRFCGPGQVFGWTGLDAYGTAAETVSEVRLQAIDARRLGRAAEQDPRVQRDLRTLLARQAQDQQTHMVVLGLMRAEEKLYTFLTHYAPGTTGAIHLPMTRGELAEYLGLTIETVSRVVTRFKRDGLLSSEPHDRSVLILQRRDPVYEDLLAA